MAETATDVTITLRVLLTPQDVEQIFGQWEETHPGTMHPVKRSKEWWDVLKDACYDGINSLEARGWESA